MEETASNMRGSCECIEKAVTDSRQGVVFQLGGWARYYQLLIVKNHDVSKYLTKPRTWTGPLVREGMDWIALTHEGDK